MQSDITHIIRPPKGWMHIEWRELWQQRQVFAVLVWRDIKIRYRQTFLGAMWAFLVPLCQMLVFSFIVRRIGEFPTGGIPIALYFLAALAPWNYFSNALSQASDSMVRDAQMLTKVYFPRLYVPGVPCAAGLVDLLFALVMLGGLSLWFGYWPQLTWLCVPFFIVVSAAAAFGMGAFLTSLNVLYRDVKHVIPFVLQIWMIVTVFVPYGVLPERLGVLRALWGLNPMAAVAEGIRWSLYATEPPPWELFLAGCGATALMMFFGVWAFKRMECTFADIV